MLLMCVLTEQLGSSDRMIVQRTGSGLLGAWCALPRQAVAACCDVMEQSSLRRLLRPRQRFPSLSSSSSTPTSPRAVHSLDLTIYIQMK